MKLFQPALVAVIGSTLILSGCGDKTLDFRNAEISNGKIYEQGANEPFTGKVTNIPSKAILDSRNGYLTFITVSWRAGLHKTPSEKNMCNVNVNQGVLDGKAVCSIPNSDIPVLQLSFNQGELDGDMEFDNPDQSGQDSVGDLKTNSDSKGNVLFKGAFSKGQPDGKQEIYSAKTGKLIHVVRWKNGTPDGEEEGYDENTGNRTLTATIVDGKFEGDFVQYAPDGKQIIAKLGYKNGLYNGPADTYSVSGKHLAHGEWNNGQKHGLFQSWDEQGKLIGQQTFENGVEVQPAASPTAASTPVDIGKCVSSWTDAYHKEQGEDAMVTADQLGEWQGWCKEGKQPG